MEEKKYKRIHEIERADIEKEERRRLEREAIRKGVRQRFNRTQASSTPQMSREEAIKRYSFNPIRTIKNAFIEPEAQWIERKQREEQIKHKAKEAYFRGLEQHKISEAYKKGRSGKDTSFLGVITGGLTQMSQNAANNMSGMGGGRRRGGGGVGSFDVDLGFGGVRRKRKGGGYLW